MPRHNIRGKFIFEEILQVTAIVRFLTVIRKKLFNKTCKLCARIPTAKGSQPSLHYKYKINTKRR